MSRDIAAAEKGTRWSTMNNRILSSPLNSWFALNSILSLSSVPLYLTKPSAAIEHFGGVPSLTAQFWCQTVASGDLLCGALCIQGLVSKNGEVKKNAARLVGLYNLFHMATFWWNDRYREPHPQGWLVYALSIVIGTAFSGYYGWYSPPEDEK